MNMETLKIPQFVNLRIFDDSYQVSVAFPVKEYMIPSIEKNLRSFYNDSLQFFVKKNTNYVRLVRTFSFKDYPDIQKILDACYTSKARLCYFMAQAKSDYYYEKQQHYETERKSIRRRDPLRRED